MRLRHQVQLEALGALWYFVNVCFGDGAISHQLLNSILLQPQENVVRILEHSLTFLCTQGAGELDVRNQTVNAARSTELPLCRCRILTDHIAGVAIEVLNKCKIHGFTCFS